MKHSLIALVLLAATAAAAAAAAEEQQDLTNILVAWHSETNRTSALGMLIAAAAADGAAVEARAEIEASAE